ncbi:predicted protein [Sclerotinia sclerotiorum 1980 UF-70]|uniref:Uncharacterized protein n=1 Tax=Sclerotinia sclerotiorum (strain ATCC 18683 / 1980 / Ss-1) TaxID=665079 RepID=A7EQT4_SCLS1|nr:predicted protein [Sclerotinia sclerotiorum 1980 UF-70]EDN91826.1 predicted protein [Sclerotinia sclerotiorum 1980 UF-70]
MSFIEFLSRILDLIRYTDLEERQRKYEGRWWKAGRNGLYIEAKLHIHPSRNLGGGKLAVVASLWFPQ